MLCLEEEKEGMTGAYLAQVQIEMGALASAIFKVGLFSTRSFLKFYYCQAGVSTRNGKILLTLSTCNIKILNRPLIWALKQKIYKNRHDF